MLRRCQGGLKRPLTAERFDETFCSPPPPAPAVFVTRVHLQTPSGGGKGGGEAPSSRYERPQSSKIGDGGDQRNERQEAGDEANIELGPAGGYATTQPGSSLALPRREGEVIDVPHGILG